MALAALERFDDDVDRIGSAQAWLGTALKIKPILALEAEISTRHLSFMETGRAMPSRAMVLRLAEQLDIPLRERNALLNAAGYAAVFPERPLSDR